jgi:hypothetical protein
MRCFGLMIVGLVLGRPVLAQGRLTASEASAPTVKPGDLIGKWLREGEGERTLMFRADSTFTAKNMYGGAPQPFDLIGRWQLAGDTLQLTQPVLLRGADTLKHERVPAVDLTLGVKLDGPVLTLFGMVVSRNSRIYKRVDSPKP